MRFTSEKYLYKLFLCTEVIHPMPYFLDFWFIVKFINNYEFLVKLANWMKRLFKKYYFPIWAYSWTCRLSQMIPNPWNTQPFSRLLLDLQISFAIYSCEGIAQELFSDRKDATWSRNETMQKKAQLWHEPTLSLGKSIMVTLWYRLYWYKSGVISLNSREFHQQKLEKNLTLSWLDESTAETERIA